MCADQKCDDPSAMAPPPAGGSGQQYYGKFRGVVLDNIDIDPEYLGCGRVLVEVPQVPGMVLNWALPSVPYAGPEVGLWMLPPIGANVWVEFEGGNPDYPIWSGCFWLPGEFPYALALSPEDPALVKILKTPTATVAINDTPEIGGILVEVTPPGIDVPVTIAIDSAGVQVECGVCLIELNPVEGITLTVTETVIAMTEVAMEVNSSEINVSAENTSVESVVEVVGNTTITGAVEIVGNTDITGAVEIEGNTEIAGAVEIQGNTNVVGATEIEGNFTVVGATELAGDLTLAGLGEAAGNVTFAGAVEVVGDLAVAGAIEGVLFGAVVPPI